MSGTLAASALLMGLAGSPHCAAMCGAACAGIAARCAGASPGGRRHAMAMLHVGRLASYAAAGALVAAGAGALAGWSRELAWLRPFWAMLHLGALALGLALLFTGRQPRWMAALGQGAGREVPAGAAGWRADRGAAAAVTFSRYPPAARAASFGLAWAAWPCGLLQSALLVAALASTPAQGALSMALFAAGSAAGLWLGPWAWGRLLVGKRRGLAPATAVRLAGALLAGASAWALGHGLWAAWGGPLLC